MLAENFLNDSNGRASATFDFSEEQLCPFLPNLTRDRTTRRVQADDVWPPSTVSVSESQEKLEVWALGTATTLGPSGSVGGFLEAAVSVRLGRFNCLYGDLSRMESLENNWDSYGAEPPNAKALENAVKALEALTEADIVPNAVVPSAEGGVGIVFVRSARYVDVEFLNEGDILMSTYYGEEAAVVEELASVADVAGVVQRYLIA